MRSLVVATLDNPSAEPFVVLLVDTDKRVGGGVKAVVVSVHWTLEEADRVASLPPDSVEGRA